MLDTKFVRENPEVVAKAMQDRNFPWDSSKFEELDMQRRELIAKEEEFLAKRNSASKEIGKMMASGNTKGADAIKEEVRAINEEVEQLTAKRGEIDAQLTDILKGSPNLPHESVPVGATEDDNVEVRRWGAPTKFNFKAKAHWDIGTDLNIIDFERGVKLARSRFVVLGGAGARLERALISFMLDTHISRGYKEWWCPAMANSTALTGTGQLPKFEDDLFKTDHGLYMIPTAEVQLTNLHASETLDGAVLPHYYCAFTPCFREEAGSAGRDTRGLIRLHQFDKVEMVMFSTEEDSFHELEGMVQDAEHILQLLDLPYRVITLCTGDMGFSAAKTYDLEVWLPSYDAYKEISSCSNCTDFQARRASIKYKDAEKFKGSKFVHTLNGSGLAVGRTMAAILENYQQEDGSVKIPDVLVPYMGGMEYIY